jgi:hypothetical protein
MKGRWELRKNSIMSALKKFKNKDVHTILMAIEDCESFDEKGVYNVVICINN